MKIKTFIFEFAGILWQLGLIFGTLLIGCMVLFYMATLDMFTKIGSPMNIIVFLSILIFIMNPVFGHIFEED